MEDIRFCSETDRFKFILQIGEKKFRASQIEEWLWKKGVRSFDEMTNLSVSLRQTLQTHFTFKQTRIGNDVQSADKTMKFIFQLHDERQVEGVLIPSGDRVTACISSQVGCPLRCTFCATGTMGFVRNLEACEIFDQFILMNQESIHVFGRPITNIVYMGMGEPLLNYDNVWQSLQWITSPKGQGLSPSRITVSTVGISTGIIQLADDNFKADLALSLHCADERKRLKMMPVTAKHSLSELQKSLSYFYAKTNKRITIEYLLLKDWNDSQEDAQKLFSFCKPFPVKINLIEYNATDSQFEKSPIQNLNRFVDFLQSKNMVVNVRHSRGKDIAAACGQLVRDKQ